MIDDCSPGEIRERERGVAYRLEREWRAFGEMPESVASGRPLVEALLDRVRLDVVVRMRRSRPGAFVAGADIAGQDIVVPRQRTPDDEANVTARQPITPDQRWTGLRPPPANYSIAKQVEDLGRLMAIDAWDVVKRDPLFADPAFHRKLAASHFWCDLYIACARALTDFQGVLASVPGHISAVIRSMVESSGTVRGDVVEAVVGMLVERIWNAAMTALDSAFPLLAVLRGPELVRAFRILALLCCPDPSRHPALVRHAVRPLAQDAFQVLREETVGRLGAVVLEPSPVTRGSGGSG